MPTKKDEAKKAADAVTAAAEAFEASVARYAGAMEAMRKGDYATAKETFDAVRAESKLEPELADRALIYSHICERKMAPEATDPTDKDQMQAVNDPDFERIREEPAFIDIIEPTPTGA